MSLIPVPGLQQGRGGHSDTEANPPLYPCSSHPDIMYRLGERHCTSSLRHTVCPLCPPGPPAVHPCSLPVTTAAVVMSGPHQPRIPKEHASLPECGPCGQSHRRPCKAHVTLRVCGATSRPLIERLQLVRTWAAKSRLCPHLCVSLELSTGPWHGACCPSPTGRRGAMHPPRTQAWFYDTGQSVTKPEWDPAGSRRLGKGRVL